MKSLLCIFLFLLAPPLLQAQEGPRAGDWQESIQPGDSVQIAVWRNPELSGSFLVSSDGSIEHPLYREVQLGGLSLGAAEERLGEYLSQFAETPQFVLSTKFRVVVSGYVARPGVYAYPPFVTVSEALAHTGGILPGGRDDRVLRVRDGVTTVVPLRDAEPGMPGVGLRSGDQLIVERQSNVLRDYVIPVFGVVNGMISLITLFVIL